MLNKNFYPTPQSLIQKMCDGIDWNQIKTILEPSAGKADILDYIKKLCSSYPYYNKNIDFDCIEIEEDLQHILEAKEYKVIFNDFLKFHTYKKYDLIIMNPPFDNGEKHLLKALELSSNIVCLLNAETIKNPYSNPRKDLIRKLKELNASIEYIENGFSNAERKTDVEVALIKIVNNKEDNYNSLLIDFLEKAKKVEKDQEETESINSIMSGDFVHQVIEQYNFEMQLGIKLINEYKKALPYLQNLIDEKYSSPLLQLQIYNGDSYKLDVNDFVEKLRYKYWRQLFKNDNFTKRMPSNLLSEYESTLNELKNYEFNIYNINMLIKKIDIQLAKSIEEKIMDLFDELSHKFSWYDETSKNIHYYNGWKTNSAYKINKKVIIPLNGYSKYQNNKLDYKWSVCSKLGDITKVFDFLDCGRTNDVNIDQVLKLAENHYISKEIELKYFYVTFYKKGTCHLTFKDDELLNKFNIFGSQRKGWLPPSYGKASYEEMNSEEKQVVDEFQGREEYQKVYNNTDFYITSTSQLLLK